MNADRKIIGAVGVIGPTRLNYGRIVPIVDYTAQLVGNYFQTGARGGLWLEPTNNDFLDDIEDMEAEEFADEMKKSQMKPWS